ncbi:MAG: MGMT family protein [bacterium]
MKSQSDFRRLVYAVLRRVPRGRVVTYGQLALIAGRRRAGREVGWIAYEGGRGLPWQRVVNRFGGLAIGYGGHDGRAAHKRDLAAEGVRVRRNMTVDLRRYQWWPDDALCRRLGLGLETLAAISVAKRRPPPEPPRSPAKDRERRAKRPAEKKRFLPDYPEQ